MRFVKRISMFFIYPLSLFAIGFITNILIMDYFYPGSPPATEKGQSTDASEVQLEELEVSVLDEPVINANTRYVIQRYQAESGEILEEDSITPDKYIGLTRERMAQEIDAYNDSPPLKEQEDGFVYAELIAFSPARIIVRKSYEQKELKNEINKEKGFFLLVENHYVVVYDANLEHMYLNTGIRAEKLPQNLQTEIINMKFVESESALFNFLESFSS